MAFKHGVYKSEVPTSLVSPVQGEAGLPVVVGCAPVYMGDITNVNKPVLCYTYSEAVSALGFVHEDWENWTLCEFMYSQFALFGQSPCVLINVFDPARHKKNITDEVYEVIDGEINLGEGVIKTGAISFKDSEGKAITNLKYDFNYDDEGNAILSITSTGYPTSLKISYVKADPSQVTANDIIGGVNAQTGAYKGLELVSRVFPMFRLIPGIILAPGWSEKSEVAAVMRAKCENINGLFTCISIADIPSDSTGAQTYSEVPAWKNANNYTSERQIVCWPKIKLGNDVYHMSTQLAGLMNNVDRSHNDVPYKSPSNELFQMDGCVLASGAEVSLGLEEANYLNGQGITTALNFMSGWVAWGNRTASYPANTDPKDCFIPIRRMFDFVGNTFIQTFWQKTDEPMTPRLVRTIIDSFNCYLNGLAAREMILGGRIEMLADENPLTSIQDGHLVFHVYLTPPPPAEMIEAVLEFDPDYFSVLYEAIG